MDLAARRGRPWRPALRRRGPGRSDQVSQCRLKSAKPRVVADSSRSSCSASNASRGAGRARPEEGGEVGCGRSRRPPTPRPRRGSGGRGERGATGAGPRRSGAAAGTTARPPRSWRRWPARCAPVPLGQHSRFGRFEGAAQLLQRRQRTRQVLTLDVVELDQPQCSQRLAGGVERRIDIGSAAVQRRGLGDRHGLLLPGTSRAARHKVAGSTRAGWRGPSPRSREGKPLHHIEHMFWVQTPSSLSPLLRPSWLPVEPTHAADG